MANYAYVSNGSIEGLYDTLPVNWKNISNFYLLNDDQILSLGWKKIIKPTLEFNSATHRIGNVDYYLLGDDVYERTTLVEIPIIEPTTQVFNDIQAQWTEIRRIRDELMRDFEWRYSRYDRQVRMGITPIDSLEAMDNYMQLLADITTQEDPFAIVWPEYVV